MAVTSPSLAYVMPFISFLFVFVVTYALLAKTKILGGNSVISLLASFLIALMFFFNPTATQFTVATVPWMAVLITALVFILLILTFVHGKIDDFVKSPVVALILIAVILLIFIGAASNVLGPLLSLIEGKGVEEQTGIFGLILNPTVLGALIILVVAAVTSWILMKAK